MKNQISEGSKTLSEEAEILFELISQEEISEEDYEEIEYLLSQKNSLIFERNDANNLPLHVACKKCDLRLAQILLEKDLEKTTVNQRGCDNITPLYYTCAAKDFDPKTKLDLAELLLNNGADPHLENPHNKITPYAAAKKRNENIGKLIEERDSELSGKNAGSVAVVDARTMSLKNVLDLAKWCGGGAVSELEFNEDAESGSANLLFHLCNKSSLRDDRISKEELKDREKNLRQFYKDNPQHASYNPSFSASKKTTRTSLMQQEERLMACALQEIIATGFDVSKPFSYGEDFLGTYLNTACAKGNFLMAKALVSDLKAREGIDLKSIFNQVNTQDGSTALHYCATYVNELGAKIVAEIMEVDGVDAFILDHDNNSALMFAVLVGNDAVVKLILEKAVIVDENLELAMPLQLMPFEEKTLPLINLMLERDIDVNARNTKGQTLLTFASKISDKELVTKLLAKGARLDVADVNGERPQDVAIDAEIKEIFARKALGNEDLSLRVKQSVKIISPSRLRELAKGHKCSFKTQSSPEIDEIISGPQCPMSGTLLHLACASGNANVVRELIAGGADVGKRNAEGLNSLAHACAAGKLEIVQDLLSNGADPTSFVSNKKNMLHLLCSFAVNARSGPLAAQDKLERLEIAKLLLGKEVDPTSQDGQGNDPMQYAAATGFNEMWTLFNEKSLKINTDRIAQINALMNAINPNDLLEEYQGKKLEKQKFKKIERWCGEIDTENNSATLLFYVCSKSLICEESSPKYLKRREDKLRQYYLRNTDCASYDESFLKSTNISVKSLMQQEERLMRTCVKDLIASGADSLRVIQYSESCKTTFLSRACERGNFTSAKILLEDVEARMGAHAHLNLNVVNEQMGATALHYCTMYDNKVSAELVERILQKPGVNFEITDSRKNTPLASAAILNKLQVAKALLAHGANPNQVSGKRMDSLLHLACLGDFTEISVELVNAGARCDAKNLEEKTPLQFLRFNEKNLPLMRLIIERGADVNLLNNEGKAPLNFACEIGDRDFVEKLLIKGARLNLKDSKERTPEKVTSSEEIQILLQQEREKRILEFKSKQPASTISASSGKTVVEEAERKIG